MSEKKEKKAEKTRIKIDGTTKMIYEILLMLNDSYSPRIKTSDILPSANGGYHAFATIYPEVS